MRGWPCALSAGAGTAAAHLYGFSYTSYYSGACDNICWNVDEHSYGFTSADYDGAGDLEVCAAGYKTRDDPGNYGRLQWQTCGNRLARACYRLGETYPHCGDQAGAYYYLYMVQGHSHAHTLYGKGLA